MEFGCLIEIYRHWIFVNFGGFRGFRAFRFLDPPRYGDSKSDGWATGFRRLGEMCEKGETQN